MKKATEIIWKPVLSSANIESTSYDEKEEILYVKFRGGKTYAYESVTINEYKTFIGSSNIMQGFHSSIKRKKTTKLN